MRDILSVRQISKSFDQKSISALSEVSFDLQQGDWLAIMGASGVGKSTLLKIVAGLIDADAGEVLINNRPIKDDEVCYVPQNFYESREQTVFELIASYTRLTQASEIHHRVREMIDLFSLHYKDHLAIQTLSGGQRQRLAFACALASYPSWILIDEPFSNLDEMLTRELKIELRKIFKKFDVGIIMATHDTRDVFGEFDHLIHLSHGKISQRGKPLEIYHRPKDIHVARFFGLANVVISKVKKIEGDSCLAENDFGEFELAHSLKNFRTPPSYVFFFSRPEDVHIDPNASVQAEVLSLEVMAYTNILKVRSGEVELFVLDTQRTYRLHDRINIRFEGPSLCFISC